MTSYSEKFAEEIENFRATVNQMQTEHQEFINEISTEHSNLRFKVENELETLEKRVATTEEGIDNIKLSTKQAKELIDEILKIRSRIMGDKDNENNSILSDIKDSHDFITDTYNKINEYKIELFGTKKKVNKQISAQEYNEIEDETEKKRDGSFFYKIENITIPGMKDNIDSLHKEYTNFLIKDQDNINLRESRIESKFSELYKKIEDLLPGATAAGLAEAYAKAREDCSGKITFWNCAFFLSLVSLGISSVVLISKGAISFENGITFDNMLSQMLRVACFELPLIWAAWAANIKVSQYTRLFEEYGHKWTMMRVFDGMRAVLQENVDANEENNVGYFYRSLLSAFSDNPSRIFDKPYNPDGPFSVLSNIKFLDKSKSEKNKINQNTEE